MNPRYARVSDKAAELTARSQPHRTTELSDEGGLARLLMWPTRVRSSDFNRAQNLHLYQQTLLNCSSITRRLLACNHGKVFAVKLEEIRLAIKRLLLRRLEQDNLLEYEVCHFKRDTLFAVARYVVVRIFHKCDVAQRAQRRPGQRRWSARAAWDNLNGGTDCARGGSVVRLFLLRVSISRVGCSPAPCHRADSRRRQPLDPSDAITSVARVAVSGCS